MGIRHQIRQLAVQALYQFDARGDVDRAEILRAVQDAPTGDAKVKTSAIEMAEHAWACHDQADTMAASLAPDWPTHRQPPVDRSILRLAFYEIASGITPVPVAINEAVELAKEYGSERSPSFINGVLDKMAKQIRSAPPATLPKPAPTADAWLEDAVKDSPVNPGS